MIFLIVISVLNFLMIILSFLAYSGAKSVANENMEFYNLKCGGEYTNLFFQHLFEYIQYLPSILLWSGILLIPNLILKVSIFFLEFKKNYDNYIKFN